MKKPLSRSHSLSLLAFFVLCGAVAWFLSSKDSPVESLQEASAKNTKSDRDELEGGDRASKVLSAGKEARAADAGESGSRAANALRAAQGIAARATGQAEFDAFNGWAARYLAAPENERGAMLAEGVAFAEARRSVLAGLIQMDPRRAIENAVPPIVRQELPTAVVTLLEERVNEQAFLGVMGVLPAADAAETPAYRREVRTDDGGVYRASTFGARNSHQTTERASIVGIAVDDFLAVDERPLRIVESGEIPNHRNNLTRRRTVVPLDDRGFVLGREVIDTPTPPHGIVETCPVSGKSTEAPVNEDGGAAPVTTEQVVVEAAGQFHFLCSGGHILGFEGDLISKEGGNGGPSKPTAPPAATQATGYKSHLLMRVAFPEALRGSVTEKEGHDLGKNVQDWFVDNSYGALSFLTTVSPLIVMPRSEAWYKDQDTSGSAYEVLNDARVAAKLAGFDPANFDFDTVIYTGGPGSFGGQAYVGGKGCWLKSGTSTGVAAHEYGHNFGLWHANFWSTANGSAIGGGTHSEYGDNFDTMGSASAGDYHFNAYQKNLLNWMPTTVVHDVTASGTYRIHQMDQPAQNPRLRYAIKTRKDADRDYWIDLRHLFATNAWVQGGVFLHWSPWASSERGSHLLDATPGSIDGKNDAPIVIGRTFSDPETGIHITPIAKSATTPPSADVVVNLGMFPGNSAPVVAVGASATSVATNAAVTLTATASDPDGDVLSYAWDYGDKSFSTTNSPVVSKSWATAGEYRVRCTASDMKGKTTSSSVIITVGTPGTFRIAGTITAGGQPLANVRVHNSLTGASYREAYTDANGTYTLTRLAAGTYNVATQLYGYTLTPTGSASVTVGPNASGVNFTAANQPQISIALQDADCAEGANTGTFRISRTGSTAAALTVSVNPTSGSATQNTDYTLLPSLSGTFTIPAGAAFLDVLVTALDDTNVESFERATLELMPSTSYVLGAAAATLWIGDADTANPLVRLTVTDRDADESAHSGQFVIERLGATSAALNVSVALSGTATNGTDYATIPTTITIPVGASSVPVNVTPIQDSGVETMETVILTISTNAAYTRAASTADYIGTVNLHDDDQPVLTVVATDNAAAEAGNDPGVFSVTRTGSTAAALTLNYGLTGSALHGTDYVPLPGVLTIPAGSSVGTVVITPIDDTIGEPAQTVVFQLRGGIAYTVGAASNATVTITDNDLPYAVINVTTGPAIEGGTAGVFRVTTTGTGTGNINVLYTVTGTATNGTDFTALTGTLSIAKNTTGNITITPIQDVLVEGYETVTITLNPDAAYSLAVDTSATMNLQDDDAPQVNVSTTDDAFTEINGSLAKFFVSRTGSTTSALTVNYTLGGTATAGADYTPPSGSVTIAAGAAGAFVDVSMLTDALAEGTETIILNVTPGASYAAGIGSATRYIVDSQSASLTTQVGFSVISSFAENAGTVNIPVTLNAAAAGTVTVEYFINGGTALGGGIDYQFTAGTLTFLPGETTKNVPVTIIDDTRPESNETIIFALSNPNNAKFGTSSRTLTITDNDAPPGVTVGFAGTVGSGLESQSTAPLTVALSTAQAAPVTVAYAVTGGTATGGGTDYTITAGTLTFAAGETVKVIPNSIIDDASVEPGETIILTLSSPTGAALSANPTFTYTITDDDAATVTIVATDADAAEPGTDTGLFTVTRTGSTTAALTVNLSVSGTAMIGADYANLANTVVIAAGASTATVLVTPLDDTVVEPTETVILTLTPGVYTIGAANSAAVAIADDEANVIITIVASDANAAESGDPGAFTVNRAGSTLDEITVNLSITGTATPGSDYTALASSVVIPAAASSVVIPVSPLTDSLNEGDETVILTALAGSGYSRGSPVSATVTIANTDDGSPPTLAPGSIVDNKGGGSVFIGTLVTYTVTFSKDMDASTVTAADFGNAGSATVMFGSVTETTPTSGVFTVQATPTTAGTLQLQVNAAAVLKSVAGINLDTTSAIADNTIITVAGTVPTLADALDTSGLTWVSSGNASWIYQTTITHDGSDAAQSGAIDHDQNSYMETALTGPGTLTFWWKVSSESGYDYLRFYLDGIEQTGLLASISGTVDWVQKTVSIPAGNHTVKWGYTKDYSVVAGSDAAWVDQVVYTPASAPDIAVEQPVDTDLVDGSASVDCGPVNLGSSSSPFTFTVKNTGTADLTGLSVSSDGANSADFTVGALGATTLAPSASTTFTVTFAPGAAGSRSAAIHIASNDTDENPFDISLTGTGVPLGTLAVTPAGGLISSGGYGGPFSPSSQQYTLTNSGSTPIGWTSAKTAPWVNLSDIGGTLAAGDSTTVTASINANADTLAVDGYIDTVTFTNTTNGNGDTTRGVSLSVTPDPATVTLGNLSQTYDGSPKSASVTTNPPDLDYSVTYAGNANPPTNAGTYAVVATITDSNYAGSGSGSLVIAKGTQTITFAPLGNVLDDSAPFALTATSTSGLAVAYSSSNSDVATVSGGTVTIVGLGTTTITASQAGDTNYAAAASVPQDLTVVRANPLAVTGGPYSVLVGQSVSLIGNASQPSFGSTIPDSSYEWDLNNDNTFGDVTGSTPAQISYATLNTTWSRVPGPNTIQLKVTDSSGKTSITSTTLTLIATLTWDANTATGGAQDGAGAWLTANQWWTGSANTSWSSSANAIFGSGGTGAAVTLASPTTVNNIAFNTFTGTYTLGATGQNITINGGITNNSAAGLVSIISPVTLGGGQSWSNNSSGTFTVSGAIGGSGDLTKSGAGTVILNPSSGTSDYAGSTTVSNGVLNIQRATALGSLADGTSVSSGAALQIQGGITVGAEPLTLEGTGVSNTGALRNISGTNIYGGLVTLAGATRINSDTAGTTLTLSNTGTITGAGLPLTLGGAGNLTISSIIGTTTGTLTKDGAGTVSLNGNNTFTGGITMNAGTLVLGIPTSSFTGGITMSGGILNVATGGLNNNAITVNGNSAIGSTTNVNTDSTGGITLNNGAILSFGLNTRAFITSGAVTGNGGITLSQIGGGSSAVTFNSTANDFTGAIEFENTGAVAGSVSVNSLADSGSFGTGNIRFGGTNGAGAYTFNYGSGAIVPLTLANRQIELAGTSAYTPTINNNSGQALTINSALLGSGTGTKTLVLGGTGGGLSKFGGNIANGNLTTLNLTKAGVGTWSLGGTNSYTGGTTLNSGSGRLIFQGLQALPSSTTITLTQNSSATSAISLLSDNSGTTTLGNTLTINHANSVLGINVFVGNNNTANGGTSSGTTTNSTIAFNKLNFSGLNNAQGLVGFGSISGANGYRLQFNQVELSAFSFTSLATWTARITPTSAPVTIAGTVQQLAGTTGFNTNAVLGLDGTNANNFVTGDIKDSLDGTPRPLSLTKSSTSTWILTGTNNYSGTTTISAGTLNIQNANALGTTAGGTSVTNGATLQLQGGISYAAEPLTLGTGASGNSLIQNESGNNTWNGPIGTSGVVASSFVRISSNLGLLTLAGTVTGNDAGTSIVLQGASAITVTGQITGTSGLTSGSVNAGIGSIRTLTAANNYTGATSITGGMLQLGDGTSGNDGTIENTSGITNSATLVFNRFGNLSSSVGISGTGAVTKTGPGSQTLSGTNSYTGITTVSGGKLFINGSLSNTAVALNVNPGATLGGTGTIGRNVTVAAGGKLEFNLSTAAASHDRLDISTGRSFGFSGASELTITSSSGASPGTYTLITGGNSITGSAPATVNLPAGWAATVSISGNSLLLNVTSTGGPGPVDHFVISSIGSTQTVGTPITGITITAQDASGNTATSFTGTVTFGGTGGFTGTSLAFVSGVLSGVSVTPTVVGSNLTFTVDDLALHTGSATITTIQPGAVNSFTISSIASPQTAGTPITGITLTAKDASNNTATGFTGTVTFGGTGGFTGTSAAFVSGVLSGVSVTPTMAGSNLTLTVSNGTGQTGSATIGTIQPGAVNSFVISSIASTQTAGTPITGITLTAKDASNNIATGFTGTVTFGGTGGFTGTSAAFVSGVLSGVSVTPRVAGSNLTFTVNDGASHAGSATIATIQPGAVNSFAISSIASPQTAGTPITGITLTAKDASNNTATGFTGTVTFGGTGGFTGTSAAFVSGVLSGVSVTPTMAGSDLTFTVNDGASHSGSATIATIQPGLVASFAISTISGTKTVGTPITGITLTAKDASNNTATGFTGTVTFGGTGGFTGTSASFTAGVLNGVSVTPTVTGSNLTFTVDDLALHTGTTTITTIQSQYAAWAGDTAFGTDANGDGVQDGLAWVLGAADPNANAIGLLPTLSTGGGNMVFSFKRSQASINPNTVVVIEVGTTLGSWPSAYTVGADTAGSTVGVTVAKDTPAGTDTVTLSVPQSTDTKKFSRLKVIQTP